MSFLARRHSPRTENAFIKADSWMTLAALALPLLFSSILPAPDLPAGPSAGFVLGIQTLGILPPPGYPLYLLLAKSLSVLFPYGDLIWRIGCLSLLFAAGTTAMIYLIGRSLSFPNIVALSASLTFAFSGFFWPQALTAGPWTFHLFLLTLCLYFALRLLLAEPSPTSGFAWLVWGFLCGLAAGQDPSLSLWILLPAGLGLVWHNSGFKHCLLFLLILLAGLMFPYLYLLVRVFSPQAFINADFVPQWAELSQSHSLGTAFQWAWWYLTARHTAPGVAVQLNELIRSGWKSYPLFAVLISGLGCFFTLLGLFIQRGHAHATDRVLQLRLVIGLLPLAAIPASWLLLQPGWQQMKSMLSLAMACWSLIGLEYCYFRLGHSDEAVAKNKNTFVTWFGLAVIVLLPVLAWWQTYPGLRQHVRPAADRNSNLAQARALARILPASAVLFFPSGQESYIFEYLRRTGPWRPDLQLTSVNAPWPGKYYGGRASMEFLGKNPTEQKARRWNYLQYWKDGLKEVLSGGTPVFVFVRPLPPDARLKGLLDNFELEPQPWTWSEWDELGRRQAGGIFRLRMPLGRNNVRHKGTSENSF